MGIVQTDEEQSCIQDGRRQGGRRGRRNGQGKAKGHFVGA